MLSDERVDDAKGLTRTRRTQDKRSTEGIDDVDPALSHTFLEIVDHRDIDGIIVFYLLFHLLKTLILKVKTVVAELMVEVFADGIKSLMNEHDTDNGTYCIDHTVGGETKQRASPHILMHQHTCHHKVETDGQRIDDHCLHIELQFLSCLGADAGYADTYQLHKLTPDNAVKEFKFIEEGHEELGNRVCSLYG